MRVYHSKECSDFFIVGKLKRTKKAPSKVSEVQCFEMKSRYEFKFGHETRCNEWKFSTIVLFRGSIVSKPWWDKVCESFFLDFTHESPRSQHDGSLTGWGFYLWGICSHWSGMSVCYDASEVVPRHCCKNFLHLLSSDFVETHHIYDTCVLCLNANVHVNGDAIWVGNG